MLRLPLLGDWPMTKSESMYGEKARMTGSDAVDGFQHRHLATEVRGHLMAHESLTQP